MQNKGTLISPPTLKFLGLATNKLLPGTEDAVAAAGVAVFLAGAAAGADLLEEGFLALESLDD